MQTCSQNVISETLPILIPPVSHRQAHQLANHLFNRGSISGLEALNTYRITSVTKVISVLRKVYNWPIRAEWRNDETGKRYVRYHLQVAA